MANEIPRFIRFKEVIEVTSLSKTEIYRRIDAGNFPAQIHLGPKSVVWVASEVAAWCEQRIAEARGVAA